MSEQSTIKLLEIKLQGRGVTTARVRDLNQRQGQTSETELLSGGFAALRGDAISIFLKLLSLKFHEDEDGTFVYSSFPPKTRHKR